MKSIIAGIVVYEPNIERLKECVESLLSQVSVIVIYDNGGAKNLRAIFADEKVVVIGNGENSGLSKGLNSIMTYVYNHYSNAEWVLTMDQDSIVPENLIQAYSCDQMGEDVAIVCPQVIDKRRVYLKPSKQEGFTFVDRCITSASCTRISAWESVGGFDENLFIDLIDNDFCKRLRLCGWKILRANEVVLDQQFGDIEKKSEWKVNFYMKLAGLAHDKKLSTNIAKLTYKKNVSPLRVYHSNKNVIYLNRKFSDYGGIGYDCYQCNSYFGFMICFSFASFVRGKQKLKILSAIIHGIKDGKEMEVLKFSARNIWGGAVHNFRRFISIEVHTLMCAVYIPEGGAAA